MLVVDGGAGLDGEAGGGVHAVGQCMLSVGWPWGACKLVCSEPAQLHLAWMMVLARIGKPDDGAHTRRGVYGILS